MRRAPAPAHLARTLLPLLVLLLIPESSAETLGALSAFLPPFLRNNFEGLVKSASDGCEILPLDILYSRQFTSEIPLTDVVEFTGAGQKTHRLMQAHKLIEHQPPHSLVVYIPGWWNSPTDESSEALVEALLQKHLTVLVVDTRLVFNRGYVSSASRINPLAHLMYNFIKKLTANGVSLSSIHLIGFSLGAHVAGITGKLVQQNLRGKIGKITALDPAKPCFTKSSEFRLDKGDAEFVQVVHSSAGILGLEEAVGHVDVYMNGVAVKQPECLDRGITIECDHAQSWKLYATSVLNEAALMGRRCEDWQQLRTDSCNGSMTVVGYGCSRRARGLFLYKSDERRKRMEPQQPKMAVFNLFDLRTWWQR